MLFSIIVSLLQAAIAVAIVSGIVYLFVKKPMVFICTIAVALILTGIVVAPSVAEEATIEVHGCITRVAPEFCDNYPYLIVTVETFNGELYMYYSEEEIDIQGVVTLVLFGDKVIDVY